MNDEPEEIIDDLETLKGLLGEDAPDDAQPPEHDVPVLDDAIQDAPSRPERLGDDVFSALLGDAWRDSLDDIFADARNEITRHRERWAPDDTDELSAALKVRIDLSVRDWLAETLAANIGALRERVVAELSAEIVAHLRSKIHRLPAIEDDHPDHG